MEFCGHGRRAGEQEGKRKRIADLQAEVDEVRGKLAEADSAAHQEGAEQKAPTAELHALRDRRRSLMAKLNQSRDEVGLLAALCARQSHDEPNHKNVDCRVSYSQYHNGDCPLLALLSQRRLPFACTHANCTVLARRLAEPLRAPYQATVGPVPLLYCALLVPTCW